jgi:hypothetical protein
LTTELRRQPTKGYARIPRPHASWRGEPWETIRQAIDAWRQWLTEHREQPNDKLVRSLARQVIRAERGGRPFKMYGRSGLWCRRHELPATLASLGQKRLHACGLQAVASGRLRRVMAHKPRLMHGRLGAA